MVSWTFPIEYKYSPFDKSKSLTNGRGSWVVGKSRGSWVWVWVKVVGVGNS